MTGDRWQYEVCRRCEKRNVVSFEVDDDVWQAVAGEYQILCTSCFDELADQQDVRYVFRAIHHVTWSQAIDTVWPHLDQPCAECAGRQARQQIAERRAAV